MRPSYFSPGLAQVPVFQGWAFSLIPQAPPINLLLYFPVLGFMYLAPLAISFSVWFFHLLYLVQTGPDRRNGAFQFARRPVCVRRDALVVAVLGGLCSNGGMELVDGAASPRGCVAHCAGTRRAD